MVKQHMGAPTSLACTETLSCFPVAPFQLLLTFPLRPPVPQVERLASPGVQLPHTSPPPAPPPNFVSLVRMPALYQRQLSLVVTTFLRICCLLSWHN